jgi:putative transposase
LVRRVEARTGHTVSAICRQLHIGRATAYRPLAGRGRHYDKPADRAVTAQIRDVIRDRASYGYRRVTAVVNRAFGTTYNVKRIRRVMAMNRWTLPRPVRRRSTRPHTGLVQRPRSNERWSSDAMEIACWNGEVVEVAFALDCCDRECLAHIGHARALDGADVRTLMRAAVTHRFGAEPLPQPIQWLTDNESMYTALETVIMAEQLGLVPITTPVSSPESNGISEAFHATLRRDYLDGADLSSAAVVLAQLPAMLADYNTFAPHSSLSMRSPADYRRWMAERAEEVTL